MAKIVMSNDDRGEMQYFNLCVKKFLQDNHGTEDDDVIKFGQCINSKTVTPYLVAMDDSSCEIVAFNKDNKERYFRLDIDSNLNVQGVRRLKKESSLSEEGQSILDNLRNPGSPISVSQVR